MVAVKSTKEFDGKLYQLFDWSQTKREAVQEASELRREGYLVRVVQAGDGYRIWRRK